jgi:uncharacterized repeat protein (TIGR01451 family)
MTAKPVLESLPRRARLAEATVCSLLVLLVLAGGARAAALGGFENLAPSPQPLTSVTVDPNTNIIYAQGNDDTTFYKYTPTTNTWTSLADAPLFSGNNGGAAYLNGKIYTVYTENGADLGVYDIATNSWSTIPNPLGHGTGNITAVGGLLYLVVGNSFVSYDPATNTTTTLADVPNFSGTNHCDGTGFEPWGALAPFSGRIYGTQGNGCNGFAVYDIASNTWSQLPNVPDDGAVLGGAIDPVTGTFLAYGPYGGSNFYSYDIASNGWSMTTFPFTDIDDGGMAYISAPGLQGIYAVEGQNNPGFTRYTFDQDARVSTSTGPSNAAAGHPALLSSTVTNGGPLAEPITFTDRIPAGLTINSITVASGTCSTSGQLVTCTFLRLPSGQSAPVNVIVTPSSAGSYTNSVSVALAQGFTETNPSNNSASATLKAAAAPAPPPNCVVPKLKGTPVNVAKRALRLLNCKVGKVRHAHSKKIRKGRVIKTSPKAGTYPGGKVVGLQVSSGPKKKKKKK